VCAAPRFRSRAGSRPPPQAAPQSLTTTTSAAGSPRSPGPTRTPRSTCCRACAVAARRTSASYEDVDRLAGRKRFARIVLYPTSRMGEWAKYDNARLVPDAHGRRHGVLPGGTRTHGARVGDRGVLVLRDGPRSTGSRGGEGRPSSRTRGAVHLAATPRGRSPPYPRAEVRPAWIGAYGADAFLVRHGRSGRRGAVTLAANSLPPGAMAAVHPRVSLHAG
jgi:hypothetical protein